MELAADYAGVSQPEQSMSNLRDAVLKHTVWKLTGAPYRELAVAAEVRQVL